MKKFPAIMIGLMLALTAVCAPLAYANSDKTNSVSGYIPHYEHAGRDAIECCLKHDFAGDVLSSLNLSEQLSFVCIKANLQGMRTLISASAIPVIKQKFQNKNIFSTNSPPFLDTTVIRE